jgi:hypothetical protein
MVTLIKKNLLIIIIDVKRRYFAIAVVVYLIQFGHVVNILYLLLVILYYNNIMKYINVLKYLFH